MCLAVPGKVIRAEDNALGIRMGAVSFSGITKEVCLSFLPDVQAGDYVLVHAGFAISKIDEEEAAETLRMLQELGELNNEGGQ